MLKHLPKKSLKKVTKHYFFAKKFSYNGNIGRRTHNSNTPGDITDTNINDSTGEFANVTNSEKVYKVSLKYFCDIGK